MNILTKKSFLFTLLITAFFATGCAGNKKKTDLTDGAGSGEVTNTASSLELNGDSDSNKAGGLVTVYFDFNSSSLTGETLEQLKANAEFLKMNTTVALQIEGNADERGGVQYNLALGEKRAKAVKDFLASSGIKASRMTTISYGKERPVSFGHDEESWSKNRRANFVVTAK
jgi:peptidoglycan-associated lipoprotein